MIRAENVSKFFGNKRALGPVSFEIADGETIGFLGLNGAGKTTALRIFACDLRPSEGRVLIDDIDAISNPHAVRQQIGFLPEHPPLYRDMLVTEYLSFAGKLRGMNGRDLKKRIPVVLEITDLQEVANEVISTLSHGFRQRVGVAQAIIHEPKLLILDEPTRGLDPVQIVEMRSMIQNLKDQHTVLISSHILTEISETCDRLLVLGKGKILAQDTEEQLSTRISETRRISVAVNGNADKASEILTALEGVDSVDSVAGEAGESHFELTCHSDVRAQIAASLIRADVQLVKLDRAHRELENIFMSLVKGEDDASN